MNQDVVNVILQEKENTWKNQDLFTLVSLYFESTSKTNDFCFELKNCLNRARRSQVILQKFEEETVKIPINGENKYEKTLEELKKFGDPFTKEFFSIFDSIHKHQVLMLDELHKLNTKLDKKLKSIKTWSRATNMVFVTAFISVLIFSVVAAAVAAPPVVAAIAGALSVPVGTLGKWCNNLWKKYDKVNDEKGIVTSVKIGTYISVKEMDNISVLVRKADFGATEEEVKRIVIDEMKKKLDMFNETIEELSELAGKYFRDVMNARTVILQRIIRYPPTSPNEEAPNW